MAIKKSSRQWNTHIFGLNDDSDMGVQYQQRFDLYFFCCCCLSCWLICRNQYWLLHMSLNLTWNRLMKMNVTISWITSVLFQDFERGVVCSEISDHHVNVIFCSDWFLDGERTQYPALKQHIACFDWWWDTCGLFMCSMNYVLLHVCCWMRRNVHAICCSLITI